MAIFYVIPSIILAVPLALIAVLVRKILRLRHIWRAGSTADGVCVRSRYIRGASSGPGDSGSGRQYHVYEFVPRGARVPVRFRESDGPSSVRRGDHVTVYYLPQRPHRATAFAPGQAPFVMYGIVCAVLFCFVWAVATMLVRVYSM